MRILAALSILVLGLTRIVPAQSGPLEQKDTVYHLAPIIVTPSEAKERETPATFTNITSRDIKSHFMVRDIPSLISETPSVTMYSENGNDIGYSYVNLRGFDQRRLSIMVNGIPQNDPEDHNVYWIDMPDLLASVGDIQIQRGAGSSFYGPPAIGGSINLVTNPFRPEPGVTLESMVGFQEFGDSSTSLPVNVRKYAASVNSGLVADKYMFYARLSSIHSEGYRAISYVDLTSYFVGAMRVDKDMVTRFHFYGGPLEDGLAYVGLPKSYNDNKNLRRVNDSYWSYDAGGNVSSIVPQKPQAIENFSQPHCEVINDWKMTPTVTVHNVLFYLEGKGFFDYDGDWVPYPDASGNPTPAILWFRDHVGYSPAFGDSVFPTFVLRGYVGNRQWGWLPNVEIDHGAGRLTLGGEIRIHRSIHYGTIQSASELPSLGFDPDFRIYQYNGGKDILSAYVHEMYGLRSDLNLMADLQLVHNRYSISNEEFLGHSFSVPYTFVNPRLGVNYNISEAWNSYVSLAYTSREPRLRNLYAAEDAFFGATPQFEAQQVGGHTVYDYGKPLAKPEQLLDAELGITRSSQESRFSADLYWMEFTNELIENGKIDIFGQPVTGNARRTRHVGIELSGSMPLGSFNLSGNLTLSRNRLVRFSEYNDEGGLVIQDGNPIAGFPDVMGNVRVSFTSDPVSASLHGQCVGPFYTDNYKTAGNRNEGYLVMGMDFTYDVPENLGMGIAVRGEIHNLLNKLYTANGFGNQFFPAAERNYVFGLTVTL